MKTSYLFTLLVIFLTFTTNAQVVSTSGYWTEIGDVNLSIVTSDGDNGDGVGDGAIFVDGQSAVVGQGVTHTFGGAMTLGESIVINTYTYNVNVSYVRFNVELYNVTDNTVLASTASPVLISNSSSPPVLTTLNYTAVASDVGDTLQVRYIRNDPGDTYRNLAIDNLSLNGSYVSLSLAQTCPFTLTPDLSLISSNATIEAEINLAVDRFSDSYLGTSAPSAGTLSSAESSYAALNISVTGGVISGDAMSSFSTASFLKTFAQHLKFNPGDTAIQEKANNTVWWVAKQFCSGSLSLDSQMYSYEDFARPASLLKDFLDTDVKDLFAYTLYEHSVEFEHYWVATYDTAYQTANGSINTDLVYNILDAMMAYSLWYDTADERYRYMRGFKRYLERFFSYTVGTTDGIKADGSGFHHWTAYNNYLYAYKTAASLLYYLRGTSFQVDQASYEVFRNAVYNQYMQANDDGIQALSTNGRRPELRIRQFNQSSLKLLAIAGGDILGLPTADPIFAGMYNRIYGVDAEFNYSSLLPFTEGFFQFNHASAGAFRKDNWVVFNKGFSNNMWGSEIYTTANRYGRYQSYGALEVLYPGDLETGNGYDVDTWDWNYSPGATVIRLPWAELHGERGRIDELQQNRFVGALTLNKKNSELLLNNHGDYGLFAMDFQEQEGLGWGTTHSTNNHNNTFTFKKSSFYFDDIIVCLGSGISNDDTTNPTITTLYQRIDNTGNGVTVDGSSQSSLSEVSFSGATDHWVLSNYGTGFYLLSGGHSLKVSKAVQQTPNYNQIWPVDYSGNATDTYYIGYLDHGTSPSNESYEYILKPDSSISEMQSLDTDIQGGNKPYTVHQQNANAHIVEHESKNIWGYAFFNSAANLSYDYVTDVNSSCLVMTEYDSTAQTLLLSLSNPDIGFDSRSYAASITVVKEVTLQGEWHFVTTNPAVQITSANATETVIEFTTVDGLSYEVLLEQGPETCASTTTFSSGSWDNGNPDVTKKAIFTEDYNTSSGNIDACTCEVRAGQTVTVEAGNYMKINGNIAVNGSLIVKHTGSVVQTDGAATVTNNGTINVELTTPVLQTRDFMVLGSPMSGETRTDVFGSAFLVLEHTPANFLPHPGVLAGGTNFADDNGDFWTSFASGPINVGEGYIVRPQSGYTDPANTTFDMTYTKGTLNNGDITRPIVYNGAGPNPDGTPNALANPYASAISASQFISANPLVDRIYFWEHLTPPSPSTPGAGSINFSMDDISMYIDGGALPAANDPGTSTQSNGVIATGQGFGIKAFGAGNVTFTNAMRLTSGNTTLRNPVDIEKVLLKVRNEQYGIGSHALIAFNPLATQGLDERYDAQRLATTISLYSHLENGTQQLGIQSREAFDSAIKVSMGFASQVDADTYYTISIASLEGNNIANTKILLVDNQENFIHNLTGQGDYQFKAGKGTFNQRFTLMFEEEVVLDTDDNNLKRIAVFPNPAKNILNIVSPQTPIADVEVYDVRGRVVNRIAVKGEGSYQMDISALETAMYFVKIHTENGSITKRIVKH